MFAKRSVVVCLLLTTSLFAQFENSEVLGTVHDPSGAPVPSATVTLTNQPPTQSFYILANADVLSHDGYGTPDALLTSLHGRVWTLDLPEDGRAPAEEGFLETGLYRMPHGIQVRGVAEQDGRG